jgi:hypothetical protein
MCLSLRLSLSLGLSRGLSLTSSLVGLESLTLAAAYTLIVGPSCTDVYAVNHSNKSKISHSNKS